MGFKENLRDEISYQGLMIKEVAEKAGIKAGSLSNYLKENSSVPSADVAVKIAKALNVSVEYLVTGKESFYNGKQSEINDKIFPLVKRLNRLSDDDLAFFAEVLNRLEK